MVSEKPAASEVIEPGESVFDSEGRFVGRVNSITETGFEAEIVDPDGSNEEIPGQEFGEGYLMWRCTECGEMGDLEDDIPSTCPNCGAPREAITEMRED